MKPIRNAALVILLVCLGSALAQSQPDSLWIFNDTVSDTALYYFQISTCDTNSGTIGCFNPVDTGASFDGSLYINFDYQFTAAQPGFSGFKVFWDQGLTTFDATAYDSICFWHKGPLPGHRVHMIWGYGGQCGGPVYYQDGGDFKSSTVWKKECIAFPAGFVRKGLFELRMLIYNDSGTTSPTSAKGCLKLDNICFIKYKGPARTAPSAAPALSLPANGASVPGASINFTWGRVDSANSYIIQASTYSSFSPVIFFQAGETGTSATALNFAVNTTYYWRVIGSNSGLTGPWSAVWSFSATNPPVSSGKKSGCGAGIALALIPPIWFKTVTNRRKRRKKLTGSTGRL